MKNDKYGPNKKMKNGWLIFYTKIKPWFSMLFGIIWAWLYIPINLDLFNIWWIAGYCTLPILPAVISFLCFTFSGTNYKKYVNLVKVSLFVDLFTISFLVSVDMMEVLGTFGHYAVGWFIVMFLVGYPTWYKLNVKYFENRIVDPEAEARVLKSDFFKKVDSINKARIEEENK